MYVRIATLAAWLVVGCGRINFDPLTGDGGTSGDGAPADAGPGLITVIFAGGVDTVGTPVVGAVVAFVEDNGPTSFETTDATGMATHLVGGTTTVHAAATMGMSANVWTFVDVAGGMTLRAGFSEPRPAGAMTVTVPPRATADGYQVFGSTACQVSGTSTTTTVALDFAADCAGPQRMVARAMLGDETLASIDLDPATLAPGATVNAGPWQAAVSRTVQIDGTPAGSAVFAAFTLRSGVELGRRETAGTAGTSVFDVSVANIPAEATSFGLLETPDAGRVVVLPAATQSVTIDDFNAAVTTLDVDESSGTVSWTVGSTGTPPVVNVIQALFDAQSFSVAWSAVVPTTAGEVVFPDVPGLLPFSTAASNWSLVGLSALRVGDRDYRASIPRFLTENPYGLGERWGQSFRSRSLPFRAVR